MRDKEIIVATVYDYRDIAGCGIHSELVQEHHRPARSDISIGIGKILSNDKHTRDLSRVSIRGFSSSDQLEELTGVIA